MGAVGSTSSAIGRIRPILSVFCSPSRYTQGRGATAALGREIAALGLEGPTPIIAGKTVIGRLADVWKTSLDEVRIRHTVHRFSGECSLVEIERAKAAAGQCGARCIVGAGGAKYSTPPGPSLLIWPCRSSIARRSPPAMPLAVVSVIYTEEGVFQEYRFYRKNPDLVLVDTQVIAQAPTRLLAAGMGDALATWFEARTCVAGSVGNMRGGGSTTTALALAELCYRTLMADGIEAMQAVSAGIVTPALERLVEANTLLSGLGFESSGLAAAHAVHNGLTAAHETHAYLHGEKVAFGLIVQLVLEGAPCATTQEVLGFSSSVGLPITLADIGLHNPTRDQLNPIARRATAAGETIHNEPFEVTPEMVTDAILAADVGRSWRNRNS